MSVSRKAWTLTKSALVCAPDFDDCCECRIRIAYDAEQGHASLSIRYNTELAGLEENSRSLTLLVRPPNLASCVLTPESDDSLIAPNLLKFIPSTSVTDAADVLTLTLRLKRPGTVLYPKGLTGIRPIDPDDTNFQSFFGICQTTIIRIHFAKAQLGAGNPSRKNEEAQLQHFVDNLKDGLGTEYIDLNRQDGGRGVQEGTWHVFDLSKTSSSSARDCSPPLACVLGKRARQAVSLSNESHVKRHGSYKTPPPYSPTVINTPTPETVSTVSDDVHGASFGNLRPAVFTYGPPPYPNATSPYVTAGSKSRPHLTSAPDPQVSLLAAMLKSVPEHVLQEALIESGHSQLLHPSLIPTPCAYEKTSFATSQTTTQNTSVFERQWKRLEEMIDSRFEKCADTRLIPLVKEMFASLVNTRLKEMVDANLPSLTKDALDKAMGEHQDQFYMDCREAEVEIQDKVDDASLEVKMVLEDGLKEIETLVERHIDRMTEEVEELLEKAATAELDLDDLRCRVIDLTKSTLCKQGQLVQKTKLKLPRCRSV